MKNSILDELACANGLLRSAYAIALRDGKDTNWESFRMQLKNTLERESEMGILKGYWEFKSEEILSNLITDPDEIEQKLQALYNDLLDPNR